MRTQRFGTITKLPTYPVTQFLNKAVIDLLAEFFDIPRSSITIASGATSRLKNVRISGASRQKLEQRLRESGDPTL